MAKRTSKRKAWSMTVEEAGVQVRIFERDGVIYRDVVVGRTTSESGKSRTRHDVRSLKHGDRSLAEKQVKALCQELAKARINGTDAASSLTLLQLFTAYRQHRVPALTAARQREAETRMTLFTAAWTGVLPVSDIDQTRIAAYCAKRRQLEVVPPSLQASTDGKKRRGYRAPRPLRDGALDGEFRFLNAVLNWASGFKTNGRPLLSSNPLPKNPSERRAIGWPKEKNPRRPVANHDRYNRTRDQADAIDPAGRLRCILALARYTARRESAITSLCASDLLLNHERIRAALADAGRNEADADHMPHGAIRWRDELDKQGYLFVTPLHPEARVEVDKYLRLCARVGEVPLFPAPLKRMKRKRLSSPEVMETDRCLRRDTALRWLARAERKADLPKLRGGSFHPYRRLWAIERRHLPAIDVAAAGGWGDTQALTRIYQRAEAKGVAAAVNG